MSALTLSLWLPSLLTVQGAYGQAEHGPAQANSVQCLSILSDGWTVGGVVLALLAIRLLLLGGVCRRGNAAFPPVRHGSGPAAVAAASPAACGGGIRLDVKDTKRVRTSPSAPFLAYNM